ncbi:MAG: hypothetical protein RIB67_07180 [Miltoncostaeaceae bacterium]
MNTGSLTREHKLFIGAGASAVFVIAMFIDWFGEGNFGINGMDVLPSGWIFLLFGIGAALLFVAEALNFELPIPVNPVLVATYLASVLSIMMIAMLLEGGDGRKFGFYLALLGAIVALVAGVIATRHRR